MRTVRLASVRRVVLFLGRKGELFWIVIWGPGIFPLHLAYIDCLDQIERTLEPALNPSGLYIRAFQLPLRFDNPVVLTAICILAWIPFDEWLM